ncbi:hypothetical protein M0805_005503 [Coniferiporia weirii]|nr:hypothetical protein M0805_005503 [Coniferiporia weirii]
MAEKAQKKLEQQESVSEDRIAEISNRIRQAIRAALPAPPEQFLTIMVPGKVVNFEDFTQGFDEDGKMTAPILPTVTELNQAILCDDMPALSSVQLGPTGRSVSRSYAATLSKLVAKGTTVGVEVTDPNKLTEAEKKFNKGMNWLLAEDERNPGKSHLDSYIEKQKQYTAAEERKIKLFDQAYQNIVRDPANKTIAQQRAAYDRWVSENARKLRNDVEGAYKDWVVHGRKEAAEYWFSIVDNDSAIARVEQSKEAMRNAVVMDTDGALAYPTVKLSPSNWARIAQKKAKAGAAEDGTKTVAQYTWEISRLQKRNRMLEVLKDNPPQLTEGGGPVTVPDLKEGNDAVKAAMKDFMDKRTKVDNLNRNKAAQPEETEAATQEMEDSRTKLSEALAEYDKANVERLSAVGLSAMDDLFKRSANEIAGEIAANEKKIEELDEERKELMTKNLGKPSDIVAKEIGLPGAPPETKPAPVGKDATATQSEEEYFTPITVEISASSEHQEASQHTSSTSASVTARSGMFSVSASMSHSKSSADAASQMAKSSVKVSFECMRVDITRSWLRPELFYDDDLQAAPGAHISPGPVRLAALMDPDSYKDVKVGSKQEREEELLLYSTFPVYPTAFLVAANVVLEISGETSAIQSHFDSSNTTASASVNFGPIQASGSHSQSSQHSSSTCETTASGCRITIKSPQIIGWISQIVPALPRLEEKQQPAAAAAPRAITAAPATSRSSAATASPAHEQHEQGTAQEHEAAHEHKE